MRTSSSLLFLFVVLTIYEPFARAETRYIDDADQIIKYIGQWNFRGDTGALNGQYTLSKAPKAVASITYTFLSVDVWAPLFPAPIQLVISIGTRSTTVDLQDHDTPAVPLPTDVPPRTSKPSRVVWSYKSFVQEEHTIYIMAALSGLNPAYAIVDTFAFELQDPSSAPSTTDSPPPSPTTSTQRTSVTPTSTPSQSSSSSSSTPSSSPLSTTSSLTSGSTSSPSSSNSTTASSPASSSESTPVSFLPQPTIIQGNAGSLDSEGSRDKGNTGLIAGLSVAGCVLAGILAGLVWLIRRKRRASDSERDDGGRQAAYDPAEGSEAARLYSLADNARLPGANGAGGGGVIGLGGAFTRALGKRNVTTGASPTSTGEQSPSPGLVTTNEKRGLHDIPLDLPPSSSAAQSLQSAASTLGSGHLSPSGSLSPSNDQPPPSTAAHSPTTTRHHPSSMSDSPPIYSAADPTSALWAQRIQMVAALPVLVQRTQPPSQPVPSNRDSVTRVQMDPELD